MKRAHNTSDCWCKPKGISSYGHGEDYATEGWVDKDGYFYWWTPEDVQTTKPNEPNTTDAASSSTPLLQATMYAGHTLAETEGNTMHMMSVSIISENAQNNDYVLIGKVSTCTNAEDRLMIDSGAQCCVCPRDYAPEIELIELSVGQLPNLRTATNIKMHVYGLKHVHYRVSKDTCLNVRYYVCDVPTPILSVSNMVNSGYAVVLDRKPHVKLHGWLGCPLHSLNGLNYILPHEISELERHRRINSSTTPKLVAVPASNKDYWKIEGDEATRVHMTARLHKFVPTECTTMPGSNNKDDPIFHRLGDERITKA